MLYINATLVIAVIICFYLGKLKLILNRYKKEKDRFVYKVHFCSDVT